MVALAFQSGGYGTRATALAATEMAVLLAVWLLLVPRPLAGLTRPLAIAVLALAALSAWAALSSIWSQSPGRAAPEAVRTILYSATLALFGLAAATPRRTRLMALGIAAAAVGVSVAALASRTLPEIVPRSPGLNLERLAYPISYWNGLGLLAAVGAVLCVHLTCHASEPVWTRRLSAAAVPLLAATVHATLSRGAALAALVGVAVYLILARPPVWLAVGSALAVPTAGALVAAQVATADRFTAVTPDAATVADGRWLALALAACALAAGALRGIAGRALAGRAHAGRALAGRALAGRAERRGRRPRRRVAVRAPWRWLAAAGVAGVLAVGLVAVLVSANRDEPPGKGSSAGGSRLLGTGSSGRSAYWTVALKSAADHPILGEGAGTFDLAWAREREIARLSVHDAHSLYLETLAELGPVGLALLLVALGTIALGLLRRARRGSPNAALWAALLTACVAWVVHAGLDWDWELPAVSIWVFAVGGAALGEQPEAADARLGPSRRPVMLRWALVGVCVLAAIFSGRLALASSRFDAAVEAAEAGDCPKAEARARDSLRLRDHSAPYVVLAWCQRAGRPEAAQRAMAQAIRLDPEDWRLHYDYALVLAAAGEDPRAEVEAARALNPRDPDVVKTADAFAAGMPKSWPVDARQAPFPLR